jgi:hydroxymethylglutaryl-CoA reductase (NADPH)
MSDPLAPLPKLPRDPVDDFAPAVVAARQDYAETRAGRPLPHLAGEPVPFEQARGNIENLVGFAQVPVGLAGPQRVDTHLGVREVAMPMATTEGAMVASYSRGMSVLREAGGARARVIAEGLSQHPILVYPDAAEAQAAAEVARGSFERFAALTAEGTRHGSLRALHAEQWGRRLILRLVFHTADAIGINMAAAAADRCCRELAERTGASEVYVHGQDVEKRANARALVEGRGRSVVVDASLPAELVRRRLRVAPEELERIGRTYATGFAAMGTQNWAVQTANGLAAMYLACGQDVAYVVESATGKLDLEVTPEGDLYVALHLPSLLVGTVGGGTGQGTAAECLAILGCQGAGKANLLAELMGAALLAGDLSLMASFCAGDFVAAHERLGRNRPTSSA